jgi:hypothetical protein
MCIMCMSAPRRAGNKENLRNTEYPVKKFTGYFFDIASGNDRTERGRNMNHFSTVKGRNCIKMLRYMKTPAFWLRLYNGVN